MSNVRVLVGTRKGAFILTSDAKREQWDVSGPHFAGWEIYHLNGSPADPNRLYASQSTGWFGQVIQRSDDGGKTWEPVGNKFAYDGVPGTHQWYDGTQHPWEFKRVWHLEPSLTDPDTVYAGVEDAALFRSSDGGQTWQELPGLRERQGTPLAAGRGRDVPAHHPARSRAIPTGSIVAISAAGAFRTDDGGQTWQPINRGLKSPYELPDPTAEVGHCVHNIAMHPSRPDVLFMQKHWDVMRSDDAGDLWHEVSGNLPSDFGFPIAVHAHEPETIYVVPIKSDSEHFPPEGKLRVYRSRTGGNEWEALTNGLPQSRLLRQRAAQRPGGRYARFVRHLLRHHRRAGVRLGRFRRSAGRPSSATFPPCCRSKSRPCHDPRGAPHSSAPAGAGQPRGRASGGWPGHPALGPGRAGSQLSDAARDDPRPGHRTAPALHPVLCLRGGSVPRAAGYPAARPGGQRRRAVHGRGGHGRRLE